MIEYLDKEPSKNNKSEQTNSEKQKRNFIFEERSYCIWMQFVLQKKRTTN